MSLSPVERSCPPEDRDRRRVGRKGARGTGSVFVRSSAMPWMDSMSISLFFGEAVDLVELVAESRGVPRRRGSRRAGRRCSPQSATEVTRRSRKPRRGPSGPTVDRDVVRAFRPRSVPGDSLSISRGEGTIARGA